MNTRQLRLFPSYCASYAHKALSVSFSGQTRSQARTFSSCSPSKRPAVGDIVFPEAPTSHHSDLETFLSYAERNSLNASSTVYVGTHYEYTVASTLAKYGVQARRVGGASDYGIDLLGIWRMPELDQKQKSQPLRVILQCKAGSQRAGPALIRELEGSFAGAPVGWRGSKVLAFLVSERTATKGVRESLGRSQWPMGFISCTKDGAVQQMLWNRRAEEEGLEGIGVGMRYTGGESNDPEVVLTCNGRHLPLVESTE